MSNDEVMCDIYRFYRVNHALGGGDSTRVKFSSRLGVTVDINGSSEGNRMCILSS